MKKTPLPEPTAVSPVEEEKEEKEALEGQSKILLFLIAGIATASTFIGRVFTGLYAVIINSSASALSLITSLRNLIQLTFQSTFGRISDRIGRKTMMVIGLFVSGISISLFPLINNGWVLVGGVVCFSIGYACYYPAYTAYQGDITNRKNRAGLISSITIVGALGSLIGLLVVGFAGNIGKTEWVQYTIILEITAGLFIVAAIISVFLVDPPRKKLEERIPFTFKPMIENPTFRRFVIVNSLMAFCMSLGWPIFPFVRGEYATAQQNTWIWGCFSLFQIIMLYATRKIIDKIGRKKLLFFGRLLMFYVPFNLAVTALWVQEWWHLMIAGAVSGASNAFYMVGQNSYILDCAPEKEKGTYTGLSNLFMGLTTFVGSLIMGIIADFLIIKYDKWTIIIILLFIISSLRLTFSMGYLFLQKPRNLEIEKENND